MQIIYKILCNHLCISMLIYVHNYVMKFILDLKQ